MPKRHFEKTLEKELGKIWIRDFAVGFAAIS